MSLTLDLFAAAGFDRFSLLSRELSTQLNETDADAVFVESSDSQFRLSTWLRGVLRSPATATGFGLYTLVGYFLYALGTRTVRSPQECVARQLEAEGSVPVYRVGESSESVFPAGGVVAALVEWGVVVATAVLFSPTGVVTTVVAAFLAPVVVRLATRLGQAAGALLAVLLAPAVSLLLVIEPGSTAALAVGVLAFLVTSARQASDRTEATLERVQRVSTDDGYERVVLLATQTTVSSLRGRPVDSIEPEIASVWIRRAFRAGHRPDD